MGETNTHAQLTRRGFLKTTAAVAGVAAAGGSLAALGAAKPAEAAGEEQVFTTICRANCFQACLLNAHVRDGKVVKMSRGEYPEEIYSGCCLRGLTLPERTYASNRLKYPLKR
ncbi:MAG: twin-arginine translocation signal domain-containing protein, partial [Eggerthellaceae bacterium]|nr:twin-arginine translocation signal domain-containing protein [Eggerthellaceae bacterium]